MGHYVIIDGEPCKVVEISKSKPGKHGSAKAHIVAIGLFDGVKRSIIRPVDAHIEQPVVEKRVAQVIGVAPETIQLMDMETYEVFEEGPSAVEEEIRDRVAPGVEVEYWGIGGRRKIVRVTGSG